MPEVLFFRDLILAIAAALVGGAVAHRLGQPPMIGYLLGGVAIGPYTPGPVSEVRHVATLADIGVMLIMFELGVEFPLTVILFVIGVTVELSVLWLSPALDASLAGLVVSRSPYSRHVLAEAASSRDLFTSLFFVSVGMLVDPLPSGGTRLPSGFFWG